MTHLHCPTCRRSITDTRLGVGLARCPTCGKPLVRDRRSWWKRALEELRRWWREFPA